MSREGAEKHKLSLGAASRPVWLEGRVWAGAKEVNGGSRGKALNAQLSGPGRGKPKNTATQVGNGVQADKTPTPHSPNPGQSQAQFGPEPRTGSQCGSPSSHPHQLPSISVTLPGLQDLRSESKLSSDRLLHKAPSVLNTDQPLGAQYREGQGEGRVKVCCRIKSREEGAGERRQQRGATWAWRALGRNAYQALASLGHQAPPGFLKVHAFLEGRPTLLRKLDYHLWVNFFSQEFAIRKNH